MKKNGYLALLCLFYFTSISYAQDTVYFQRQVHTGTKSKKNKSGSTERSIIKIATFSFLSGYIPVFFEREISPWFSIQAGLGLTSHNYMEEWISKADEGELSNEFKTIEWNDGANEDAYQNEYSTGDYTNRKSKIGTFFALEPRVYFENEGLDGSFLSLTYRKMNYKTSTNTVKLDGTFDKNSNFIEKKNVSDILVSFGYQSLYDRLSVEYSTGLGIRQLKGEKYVYANNYNNSYIGGVGHIDKTKLAFNLSLKVGYHF